MKSQNTVINNTFQSTQMPWTTIKNEKIISGVKYINSLRIQSCILKKCRKLAFFAGTHFVTQKYQYLMNGNRYDQIRSLCVQKTYITISEWISYYIDWKMAFVCLLYQPSAPKLRVYCNIIQAILSMKFQNIPMNNTFLSELMTWAIIKNVKSTSRVNHIDSLYMKWCTLKNMGNWPFSPGHTLSHKTNNILRTTVDMTKIKTNVCRKPTELSMIATSSALIEKGCLCNYFPTAHPPTPKFFAICSVWFCLWYCKYLRYTSHFCFLYRIWCW